MAGFPSIVISGVDRTVVTSSILLPVLAISVGFALFLLASAIPNADVKPIICSSWNRPAKIMSCAACFRVSPLFSSLEIYTAYKKKCPECMCIILTNNVIALYKELFENKQLYFDFDFDDYLVC